MLDSVHIHFNTKTTNTCNQGVNKTIGLQMSERAESEAESKAKAVGLKKKGLKMILTLIKILWTIHCLLLFG